MAEKGHVLVIEKHLSVKHADFKRIIDAGDKFEITFRARVGEYHLVYGQNDTIVAERAVVKLEQYLDTKILEHD